MLARVDAAIPLQTALLQLSFLFVFFFLIFFSNLQHAGPTGRCLSDMSKCPFWPPIGHLWQMWELAGFRGCWNFKMDRGAGGKERGKFLETPWISTVAKTCVLVDLELCYRGREQFLVGSLL